MSGLVKKEDAMKKIIIAAIFSVFMIPSYAISWDGFDYQSGNYIEIESGNLVRTGRDIEIFDYQDGTYRDVEVTNIDRYGSTVEVEVFDYERGEYRTFEMDD